MSLIPDFELGLWNAWIFTLPIIIISILGPKILGKKASEEVSSFTKKVKTVLSPSIDYTVRSSSPEATWSGSDDIAGIDRYEARIDQGTWINEGLNTSCTFRDLPDGTHTLSVKAIDRVGLTKEESTSFIINTSLIGGPGWSDDIVVFGLAATAAVVIGVGAYLSKKKTKIPPPS